jgi:hypothetical protein
VYREGANNHDAKEKGAMERFLSRFASSIGGVLSGFDRLVLSGQFLPLMYPRGMMGFLSRHQVLLKDFMGWAKERTEQVKSRFAEQAVGHGHEVRYLGSPSTRKEELVRALQRESGVTSGVIGSLSCVEPCRTWDIRRDPVAKVLVPVLKQGSCLHLYRYWDHPRFGFMHVRLQTWFPFSVRVCLNGREFLRRQLDRSGIDYEMRDNCFAKIASWPRAQRLMDALVEEDWMTTLNTCVDSVFPDRKSLLGDLPYHWGVWQSEWASDVSFVDTAALDAVYLNLQRHAMLSADTPAVLRFFGRPVTAKGRANGHLQAEVTTRLIPRTEGTCIKHHVGRNSVKMYNKQGNTLRVETTINDPSDFKVYRRTQGGGLSKSWLTMRTSVADLHRRTEVSQGVNDRYLDHQANVLNDQPLQSLINQVTKPVTWKNEHLRALDLTGKDRWLIDLLNNPAHAVTGIRNADLRQRLPKHHGEKRTDRQLTASATRHLRLLRAHGIIKKISKTHRYQLTDHGRTLVTAMTSALAASTKKLTEIAA